jgi:hypothetical protein
MTVLAVKDIMLFIERNYFPMIARRLEAHAQAARGAASAR